ncbi:hypothetical protein QU481_02825 [Crenobacter sp. SG2303]|uniref:Uncharacterized protein n=1 Tax=Crenobacter oryzisoli TaxID=3056844 RepID=A0ABT7XJS8_9NEIS|nr:MULTISPECIES: hypothetical protein [unclassified Crenobacter]MDN0073824.1 hypothetical protein [Crenobacter sp. SG2303]MDN0081758.1 hypothetical protein [Crenobacter sp. SG2305]
MKINQLKPGHKITEHKDGEAAIQFEVVQVKPVGRKFEITFLSRLGLTSAVYPAEAFVAAL